MSTQQTSIVAAPIFMPESAPARIRGALVVGYQVATVVGITVAYFVDYGLAGSSDWRLMLALSAVPAVLVLFVLLRLPDTPRWYLMKGRVEDARDTLIRTDPEADVEQEIEEIQLDLSAEHGGSLREMARRPYARATIFVVVVGFLVQITGINAITYYSPFIFQKIGWSGNTPLLVQGFVEVFSVLAVVAAVLVVDRLGRRVTLLTGIGVMVASNVLMVVVFAAGHLSGGLPAALGFIGALFYTAGFNFGFGALVWVYASESFPARLRTAGASAMLTADLVANLIISRFFLSVFQNLGGTATFAIFLGLAVVSWIFIWAMAPETTGRPLEAIRLFWENGGRWPDAPEERLAEAARERPRARARTTGTPAHSRQ